MRKVQLHKRTQSQHITKITKPHIDKDEINNAAIFERLKESLKIFEKIQKNFELTSNTNNLRETEIKNIIRNISIDDYPFISDFEKRMINDQIVESSDQRIQNYKNLFNIINTALKDLRECFVNKKATNLNSNTNS